MKFQGRIDESYRNVFFIFVFIFIFSSGACTAGEKLSQVEGIFYLDNSPVTIEIVDGKIEKIVRKEKLDNPENANLYVAPGLIDHQLNGYFGIGFVSPDLTVEQVQKATRALWKNGITSYLPTLRTSPHELLMRNLPIIVEAKKDAQIALCIPGIHVEGPYISPIDGYRGAHKKEYVRNANYDEFLQYYKASEKQILEMTVAPERPGVIDFTRKLSKLGVVVAIGHSAALTKDVTLAADAGARVSTHLGNGCANTIHRHNNPLWPQLSDDRLIASIICDGFHLRREEVRTFYKVKGPDRTILVSDMGRLSGMPPGEYERHGKKLVVTPEGKIMMPEQGVLAGASMPISVGVGNIMKFTGCTLGDAINMASRNPARLLNLKDRGEIKPGKRADLILFELKNNKMFIKKTIIAGEVVYTAQK